MGFISHQTYVKGLRALEALEKSSAVFVRDRALGKQGTCSRQEEVTGLRTCRVHEPLACNRHGEMRGTSLTQKHPVL